MPSIQNMLAKPLPPLETSQERDARMAEFYKRFPALAAAIPPEPGYRSETDAYGEGIIDDD